MKRSTPICSFLAVLFLASIPMAAVDGPQTIRITTRADRDAYLLMEGNQSTSMNISLDDLQRLRRTLSGDVLWLRRGGSTYVIQDKAFLLQVKGLFAPLRALDPEREELHRRERALDRKEEAFDREEEELDRIRDSHDDEEDEEGAGPRGLSDAERRDLERRSRELESLRRPLREEQREIEALERAFDRKEEELEKKAEGELWKLIDRALASGLAVPSPR